jgi:hypothetical protein
VPVVKSDLASAFSFDRIPRTGQFQQRLGLTPLYALLKEFFTDLSNVILRRLYSWRQNPGCAICRRNFFQSSDSALRFARLEGRIHDGSSKLCPIMCGLLRALEAMQFPDCRHKRSPLLMLLNFPKSMKPAQAPGNRHGL